MKRLGEWIRRAGILVLLSGFLSPGLIPGLSRAASLTLLHTNDTHGRLQPFSHPSNLNPSLRSSEFEKRSPIGGIARRATLVKQIRGEAKDKGMRVWLVDAGDFSDGTPLSKEYRGEADVAAMNHVGYDFATLGNHEFNHSLSQTRKLISLARFPLLCANAFLTASGEGLTKPYAVEQIGPLRVGIFGLVTMEAASYPAAREGISIADEIKTAQKVVPELRSKADIIILISHCIPEVDRRLASTALGIDVIVGGHSHSRLSSGKLSRDSKDFMADAVNGALILRAQPYGGELGRCDLLFEKDSTGTWHVNRYRTRLIPVTAAIRPDAKVAELVDRYWSPIASRYSEIIGRAAGDFSARGDDRAEYNLVCDAVRETFGTEVELENLGGIRSPLVKGEITLADVVTLDPFEDTVVTFRITGLQLRELLKKHRPAVSGLCYRLVNGELIEATVKGKPLKDDRIYTGSSNSYFAGYALPKVEDTGKKRADVLAEYIRRKGTIRPSYDGRRVVIGP